MYVRKLKITSNFYRTKMSDHAMKPYTQGEFENELNDITGPYSITSKYAKLKKSLQVRCSFLKILLGIPTDVACW